jgi:hypothetical protein
VARAVVFTCIAAIVVFAVVQDRVTVAGVGEYVTAYRDAAAGRRQAVTIDEIMKPAVTRAYWQGTLWGSAVLIAGLGGAIAVRRRTFRE